MFYGKDKIYEFFYGPLLLQFRVQISKFCGQMHLGNSTLHCIQKIRYFMNEINEWKIFYTRTRRQKCLSRKHVLLRQFYLRKVIVQWKINSRSDDSFPQQVLLIFWMPSICFGGTELLVELVTILTTVWPGASQLEEMVTALGSRKSSFARLWSEL